MSLTGYLRFPHVSGGTVVFTAADDVWTVDADGGAAHRLTADAVPVSRPRLSPDGTTLAWVSRRHGEPEVFVLDLTGDRAGEPRQLTFLGHAGTTILGFAPDRRVLVSTAAGQPFRSHVWCHAYDPDGHRAPERLPYGPVIGLAFSENGQVLANTGYLRDPAQWKRYRGGTAGRLWLDAGDGQFNEILATLPGPKTSPVRALGRWAFLADFEGHGNVYSVDDSGADLRRHTDHDVFYARQLASDGTRLVYSAGGILYRLDSLEPDSQAVALDVTLSGGLSGREPQILKAADHLGTLDVDATGRASVAEVRGQVVWLTHRAGPATTLAAEPGVRHRLPLIVPTTASEDAATGVTDQRLAWVTDAGGADAIEIRLPDGTVRTHAAGAVGRVLELVASPDGSRLAIATHDGRLLLLDPADGTLQTVAENTDGENSGLAFSPDSAWLTYAAAEPSALTSIRLLEIATGAVTRVTTERFHDSDPVFTLDGRYLCFLSARTFDPVYDSHVFDLSFPLATRPYLVPLAITTPSPFDASLDGRPTGPESDGGRPDADPAGSGRHSAGTTATEPARVDLDGLADRVVPFPVAAGRLSDLKAVKGGLVWADAPIAGELGESRLPDDDVRPALVRWDLTTRTSTKLADKVDDVAVSGDGSVLLLRDHDAVTVVPADRKVGDDSDDRIPVDLSRIRLRVETVAEWRQMILETGRLMFDHFWAPDLRGIDWPAAVGKYLGLLDRIATRDDLSDVLWELNGETGSSHAYETPPRRPVDARLRPGFLGADFAPQDGRWVIARVLPGDNSARNGRSPLTAPGVDVRAGDVLVAVDSRPIPPAGPAELLLGTADRPVVLTVERDGVERLVVVTPLAGDEALRYLDWVQTRRELARESSGGRVGYIHVPDMVSSGWAALHRDLHVAMQHDALLLDTRDNAGGHTSQLVIEKLARRVIGWDIARYKAPVTYPDDAPRGPVASLANEWSGSDGDIVNAAFKALALGPVIGTRTWGGVVGIDGRYALVDGTRVTQPRYAFWFASVGWEVENHGVDPDQVVEFPPQAWAAGADPQLAAGVGHLLSELDRRPAPPQPDPSTSPSLAAPSLPPRSDLPAV